MEPSTPHCKALASPGFLNFSLSIIILLGILLSYLPQHYRIITRKTSFGISPYFVLLGTTSGTCAFANILVLPRSGADIACCKEISGISCFAGLLGIFQVGVQWFCFATILFLFVIYFPRASPLPTIGKLPPSSQPTYRTAVTVTIACILHAIIILILSLCFVLVSTPSTLQSWANVLGVMAAILSSIQYFPQIYTTFKLRRVGSLSIPMMCIQTPGSLVWASSLAARLGMEGWSSWGVYVVTAALQGTLLSMGVYFEYINPRKPELVKDATEGEEEVQDGEDGDREGENAANGSGDATADSGTTATQRRASEQTPLLHGSS
ncbi:hypothetical protein FQN54_003981 [Arachnomyces sp. PD_36]|nr:hypothetical protein FQN54_003981 [Arachnomyces sp. PD_36]